MVMTFKEWFEKVNEEIIGSSEPMWRVEAKRSVACRLNVPKYLVH